MNTLDLIENLFDKLGIEQESSDSFKQFIKNSTDKDKPHSNKIGFFMFYAPWCPHCENKRGFLTALVNNYSNIIKTHTYNCEKLGSQDKFIMDNVKGYPTLKMVYKNKTYDIDNLLEFLIAVVAITNKDSVAHIIELLKEADYPIDIDKSDAVIEKFKNL